MISESNIIAFPLQAKKRTYSESQIEQKCYELKCSPRLATKLLEAGAVSAPKEGLLYVEELATALGRSRTYVYAMRKAGFPMPGAMATLDEAHAWLLANPRFMTKLFEGRSRRHE